MKLMYVILFGMLGIMISYIWISTLTRDWNDCELWKSEPSLAPDFIKQKAFEQCTNETEHGKFSEIIVAPIIITIALTPMTIIVVAKYLKERKQK